MDRIVKEGDSRATYLKALRGRSLSRPVTFSHQSPHKTRASKMPRFGAASCFEGFLFNSAHHHASVY